MAAAMEAEPGPESRSTPMPPRPGGVAMAAIVSLPGELMVQAPRSICRVMTHCCAIDSTLFTSQ